MSSLPWRRSLSGRQYCRLHFVLRSQLLLESDNGAPLGPAWWHCHGSAACPGSRTAARDADLTIVSVRPDVQLCRSCRPAGRHRRCRCPAAALLVSGPGTLIRLPETPLRLWPVYSAVAGRLFTASIPLVGHRNSAAGGNPCELAGPFGQYPRACMHFYAAVTTAPI